MQADIINPFVTGAVTVLKQLLPGYDIKQGDLAIKETLSFSGNKLTIINYFGDREGLIIFDMTEKTSIKVAEQMNNAIFNSYNDMVIATVKEVANMIAGKAISYLRENGIYFEISTPDQMNSEDFIPPQKAEKALCIPINSTLGVININVFLFP